MTRLARHLLAVTALPFVVAVVVPTWLAGRYGAPLRVAAAWPLRLAQLAGLASVIVGLLLFVASLRRFAADGEGTLAPWDPPRRLVISGPYRYARHPMISGVFCILLGESLILLSRPHATWMLLFLAINAVYLPLVEEPRLMRRFGAPYGEYRRHVPALIPRLRPWDAAVEERSRTRRD
jgi:protein-S-isoprenylcysteine O-methyltransferase Ste14